MQLTSPTSMSEWTATEHLTALWAAAMFVSSEAPTAAYANDNWRRYNLNHIYAGDQVEIFAYRPKENPSVEMHSHLWINTDFLQCRFKRKTADDEFALSGTKIKLPQHDNFITIDGEGPWLTYCERAAKDALKTMHEANIWDGKNYLSFESAWQAAVAHYFENNHNIIARGRPKPLEDTTETPTPIVLTPTMATDSDLAQATGY